MEIRGDGLSPLGDGLPWDFSFLRAGGLSPAGHSWIRDDQTADLHLCQTLPSASRLITSCVVAKPTVVWTLTGAFSGLAPGVSSTRLFTVQPFTGSLLLACEASSSGTSGRAERFRVHTSVSLAWDQPGPRLPSSGALCAGLARMSSSRIEAPGTRHPGVASGCIDYRSATWTSASIY